MSKEEGIQAYEESAKSNKDGEYQNQMYLTRHEAAAYLRVSIRHLDHLLAEGYLNYAQVGQRRVILRREDLDQYVRDKLIVVQKH